jgi:hypothetical protein
MKDEQKASLFRELVGYTAFQAQALLEDEIESSTLNKLLNLDTTKGNLELEYARLRGCLEAIKLIKAQRSRLVEQARSRTHNS